MATAEAFRRKTPNSGERLGTLASANLTALFTVKVVEYGKDQPLARLTVVIIMNIYANSLADMEGLLGLSHNSC